MKDKLERLQYKIGNIMDVKVSVVVAIIVVLVLLIGLVGYYTFIKVPAEVKQAKQSVVVENDINAMESTPIVKLKEGQEIQPYTQLTDRLIQQKLEQAVVPVQFATEGVVGSLEEIEGMITTGPLNGNQQVTAGMLSTEDDWYGDFDRLKEFTVTNNVGGQLEEGNIVDVVVTYGNGDYDVVMAKKKVVETEVQDQGATDGASEALTGNGKLIFEVDEREYRDLELAGKLGEFEVRLYRSEEQPASPITFDYYPKLRELMAKEGEEFYYDFTDKFGFEHDEDGNLIEYEGKEEVEEVESGDEAGEPATIPSDKQGVTDKTGDNGEDEVEGEEEEDVEVNVDVEEDEENYDEYTVE